jgi:hypothetical protein
LNFDSWPPRLRQTENQIEIWDPIRQNFFNLTPEEEVRQWLISYLTQECHYPKMCIGVERQLTYNNRKKRFDLLVFDSNGEAKLLIETKRPSVKLEQKVFDQVSAYNQLFRVPYLCIFNGLDLMLCKWITETASYTFLDNFPSYESLGI